MATYDRRRTDRSYRLLRRYVLERDGHVCQIRGPRCSRYATQVDHAVPIADGGSFYDPANLRAACAACNGWLAANRTNARRYRDTLARYETRL